ncbi:MAG: sigma-70 family RNA polymerase sigma factor [Candidatus Calescibacterium sp.]|jgi:RNA polymerase sigma factor (sigma-70 family)
MTRKIQKNQTKIASYVSKYFSLLSSSKLLSPKEERELFRKNEEYMITMICELISLPEAWREIDRILAEMIETANFPSEFFDITKSDWGDIEKKSNRRRREELAAKIKNSLLKSVNYYKVSRVFAEMGNRRMVEKKFEKIAELLGEIGVTLEFIHHIKSHIVEWFQEKTKNDPSIVLKDEELKNAKIVIDKVNEISKKMKVETNKIYSANLRLAVTVAKKYYLPNIEFLDFIQEGNIALAKAIEKFNWRRGTKFSTYAVPWLRQAIMRAVNDTIHPVRLPGHIVEIFNKISRFSRKFFQEHGREPDVYEVSRKLKIPIDKVEIVLKLMKEPVSVDGRNSETDDNSKPLDIIPEGLLYSDDVLDSLERKDICKMVRAIISESLSSKERKIIEMRKGFSNGKEATLDEVSEQLNMTKERVRQIEQRAMQKLKKVMRKIKPIIEGKILLKNGQDLNELVRAKR